MPRAMVHRRLAVLLLLVALLAPAAPVAAQSTPFAPLPQAPQEPAPQPVRPTSLQDDDLSAGQTILILVAAGAILGGIAWFVIRDAHGRAPVDERPRRGAPGAEGGDTRQRSSEEHRKAKERSRAAAKRARQARKRNR